MQTETVEVKSKGEIVDTIEISQFDSIDEALQELGGEEKVLELVNRQYKSDLTNAARSAKTRSASPLTVLKRKAEADPAARDKINAVLAELGIEGQV